MSIGQITLLKPIEPPSKAGTRADLGPRSAPDSGAPGGFITALRRRAGNDADGPDTGKGRAQDVRPDAQDASKPKTDASDPGATDAIDTDDPQPLDQPEAVPTDETHDDASAPGETDATEPRDDTTPRETDEADAKDTGGAGDATAEPKHTQHTPHTKAKAEVLDVPAESRPKGEPAFTKKHGAAASSRADAGAKGAPSDAPEIRTPGEQPSEAAARARERARAHAEAQRPAPTKAEAPDTPSTDAKPDATPSAARHDKAQPAASTTSATPLPGEVPTDGLSDRAAQAAPKATTASAIHAATQAARTGEAKADTGTAHDKPDDRGTPAQPVRTHQDNPGAPKAQVQPESLFRLTLDTTTDAASAAKSATNGARAHSSASGAERAFAAGLSRGISAVLNQKGGALTMRLTPATLGDVRIQMSLKGGQVSVQLEAANAQAHDLLKAQLPALKQTLEAKGLTVERLGVQLSASAHAGHAGSGADHQGGAQGNGSGGARPEDAGAHHDAGDGRSRGARDHNHDAHDPGRGGDTGSSAFEELFGGFADGADATQTTPLRLGLDAVI